MRGERYNPLMYYSLKFISSVAVKFIGSVAAFFTLLFDGAPRSAAVRGGRLFKEARSGEGFLFIRWTYYCDY